MDKKNWWVILGLLAVIAIVAAIGFLMPRPDRTPVITVTDPGGVVTTVAPDEELRVEPQPTDSAAETAPEATATPEQTAEAEQTREPGESEETSKTPRGWLLISVDNKTYAPYPLTKTGDYTVNQKKKNAKNVIHVTEDSIEMAFSTCDNQLCVSEGVVTLENKADRILGNYIVCLPNGVTLELLNQAEYLALMSAQQ